MSPKLITGKAADVRIGAAQYVPVVLNDERGECVCIQQGPDFEIDPDEAQDPLNSKRKRLDSKSPREDEKMVFDFEEMMSKTDVEI